MSRVAGRQKGTLNVPTVERIRANHEKLAKLLLQNALRGDTNAIVTCLGLAANDAAEPKSCDCPNAKRARPSKPPKPAAAINNSGDCGNNEEAPALMQEVGA